MHYVVDRWLGGALTNFQTIRLSINRLTELESLRNESALEGRSKKEVASLRREEHKLHRNLDGIRTMEKLPGLIVVIDIGRELNAVREARKLNIPIIALVDTNCDPSLVDFPIPSNDDGIRSTKLIISKIVEAIGEGVELRKKRVEGKKEPTGKPRTSSRKKKKEAPASPPAEERPAGESVSPEEPAVEPVSAPEASGEILDKNEDSPKDMAEE